MTATTITATETGQVLATVYIPASDLDLSALELHHTRSDTVAMYTPIDENGAHVDALVVTAGIVLDQEAINAFYQAAKASGTELIGAEQ